MVALLQACNMIASLRTHLEEEVKFTLPTDGMFCLQFLLESTPLSPTQLLLRTSWQPGRGWPIESISGMSNYMLARHTMR